MPNYELECHSCKHTWDETLKITAPVPHCPNCSSVDTRRLISRTSFVLDGSGWAKQSYEKKRDIF